MTDDHPMKYHSITSLSEIRAQSPCKGGWEKLLAHLGKTAPDDEPLPLLTVLESNGLSDAIWCLRVPSLERFSRHFQAACAERGLHLLEAKLPCDTRVRDQIAMLRNDTATPQERENARAAAWAARAAAAWDAREAAWAAAARDAAEAAWAAAEAAAWAARDAAEAAAWAAWDAARNAEREWQEAELRRMIAEVGEAQK